MTDLRFNYPSIDLEATTLVDFLNAKKSDFNALLQFPSYQGTKRNLDIASKWLKIDGLINSQFINIAECNSANHSLTCLLHALRATHKSIIAEPFTYPSFKAIALANNFLLHSSEFDSEGLTIEGLEKTFLNTNARAIYLQPTIHNPTCAVMSLERRKSIAEFAKKNQIIIIEDDAYRFLHPNPPLRFLDLIPENTFHIFSLSKPFNPFIKTSYLIFPDRFTDNVVEKVRMTSSGHSSLLSSMAAYVMENNILNTIISEKQTRARELQHRLLPLLNAFPLETFSTSYHVWLALPKHIKSDILARKILEQNIVVPSSSDFALHDSIEGQDYLRIAFGGEKNISKIEEALNEIVRLINQ